MLLGFGCTGGVADTSPSLIKQIGSTGSRGPHDSRELDGMPQFYRRDDTTAEAWPSAGQSGVGTHLHTSGLALHDAADHRARRCTLLLEPLE